MLKVQTKTGAKMPPRVVRGGFLIDKLDTLMV